MAIPAQAAPAQILPAPLRLSAKDGRREGVGMSAKCGAVRAEDAPSEGHRRGYSRTGMAKESERCAPSSGA
jgi:hypothetical protein